MVYVCYNLYQRHLENVPHGEEITSRRLEDITLAPTIAPTLANGTCAEESCVVKVQDGNEIMIFIYALGVCYMFVALAIVCDEFFVPALEEMANEDHMNLSM